MANITQNDHVEFERTKVLYEMFREQIRHEDALINERISWSLTSQGFLFIAYSALLSQKDVLIHMVYGFSIPVLVTILGIFLSLTALSGLASAMSHLHYLNHNASIRINPKFNFPKISGADAITRKKILGILPIDFNANFSIRSIPTVFICAWIFLCLASFVIFR